MIRKMMVRVTLTADELAEAFSVGARRVAHNAARGYRPARTREGQWVNGSLYEHVRGAVGECVLAKHLGITWAPRVHRPDKPGEPDVGVCGVRFTVYSTGKLIVQEKDANSIPMVLVTGDIDQLHYMIRGWLYAGEAKQERFWGDHANQNRPHYAIPQDCLRPAETIPRQPLQTWGMD
jgi:hypothetical protein